MKKTLMEFAISLLFNILTSVCFSTLINGINVSLKALCTDFYLRLLKFLKSSAIFSRSF